MPSLTNCTIEILSCQADVLRLSGIDDLVFAPVIHPPDVTSSRHAGAMSEYGQALAESRAAHRAFRRALLPAPVPRGRSSRRTDSRTIAALRHRVKAANAHLAALRLEWEQRSVEVPPEHPPRRRVD
jgi:hypothetical protein